MKLFTALAAFTLAAATPAQALPLWSYVYAKSHCEYLSMGASWDQASMQAIQDSSHWEDEMTTAYKNDLFGKIVSYAVEQRCESLDTEAFRKYRATKDTSI